MKKKIVFLLACILVLPLALYSCGGGRECTEHIDENIDGKCDVCGETVTPEPDPEPCTEHEDEDGDEKCDKCGEKVEKPEVSLPDITAVKVADYLPSDTLNIGDVVTYTITITNSGDKGVTVTLTDVLPTGASYVSGADKVEGKTLKWTVPVAKGGSMQVSYKIKVNSDVSLYDSCVFEGNAAKVDGERVESYPLYVRRTLTDIDAEYLRAAMKALNDSTFEKDIMLKCIYWVAFSKTNAMTEGVAATLNAVFATPNSTNANIQASVAPTLFGGTAIGENHGKGLMGKRTAAIAVTDLVVGDALLVELADSNAIYIYDDGELYDINGGGIVKADTAAVLASLSTAKRYAVIRPSMTVLKNVDFSTKKPSLDGLTDYQKNLVKTAEAYLLRGERIQYDDSRFAAVRKSGSRPEFRWQKGYNAPEDYAYDRWAYTNCAAFCHDVYLYGLGYEIGKYTTSDMATMTAKTIWTHVNNLEFTSAQKESIKAAFASSLEVGDLIVIRRSDSSGHVMLYVGGGRVIHSSGSSYNYSTSTETYEPSIRYMDVFDYFFTPGASNNVFEKTNKTSSGATKYAQTLYIIRPLKDYSEPIADESLTRNSALDGIRVEKVSSHARGRSVNIGDAVTFSFKLYNSTDAEKTVTVSDKVPANTTFLSVDGGTHEGGTLSFAVTLAAGETKTVSYTVTASGADGTSIYGTDAKINGVGVKCPRIYIKKTLTEAERTALKTAIATFYAKTDNTLTGIELLNAIYTEAGLAAPFESGDAFSDVAAGVLTYPGDCTTDNSSGNTVEAAVVVASSGKYRELLVDGMFGGRYLYTSTLEYLNGANEGGVRIRLIRSHNLEVGDVLIAKTSKEERVFIYDGTYLYNLTAEEITKEAPDPRLSNLLAYQHFFMVLRPSYKNS